MSELLTKWNKMTQEERNNLSEEDKNSIEFERSQRAIVDSELYKAKKLVDKKTMYIEQAREHIENMDRFSLCYLIEGLRNIKKRDQNMFPIISEIISNYLQAKYDFKSISTDMGPELWVFDKGIFVNNKADEIISTESRNLAGEDFTNTYKLNIKEKIISDSYVDKEKFFKIDDDIVILENGRYIISQDKFIEGFDNIGIHFIKHPIIYDPNAKCQRFKAFIREITDSEDAYKTVQQYMGYMFWKNMKYHKHILATGTGANGKGKLQKIIEILYGRKNISHISLQNISEDQYCTGDLFLKVANVSGEMANLKIKEKGKIKEVLGGDTIATNRKFKGRIEFDNFAKCMFFCNEVPNTEVDDAWGRRYIILNMTKTFMDQIDFNTLSEEKIQSGRYMLKDADIIQKIELEISGIFNWCIEGLREVIKNKDIYYNKTLSEVKQMWLNKSDSVNVFVEKHIEYEYIDPYEQLEGQIKRETSFTSSDDIYKKYEEYCRNNNMTAKHIRTVMIELKNAIRNIYGYNIEDSKKYVNKVQVRGYNNIRIKNA